MDFELMRMRLLNPSLLGHDVALQLRDAEREAVISYLHANVPQVAAVCGKDNLEAVKKLVTDSILVEATRLGQEDEMSTENVLVRQGKPTNTCILILSGKILVMAGQENFRIEMGPWSMFGADVLTLPEDRYVPDFTASIMSPEVRYLRIFKPTAARSAPRSVGLIGVPHTLSRRLSSRKHHSSSSSTSTLREDASAERIEEEIEDMESRRVSPAKASPRTHIAKGRLEIEHSLHNSSSHSSHGGRPLSEAQEVKQPLLQKASQSISHYNSVDNV
jgi:hypothetical protein